MSGYQPIKLATRPGVCHLRIGIVGWNVTPIVYVRVFTESFYGQVLHSVGLTICQETRLIKRENGMLWVVLVCIATHTDPL